MKTITKKSLLKKLETVPNNYEIFMHYDTFINDPVEECIIDHDKKRITLL